jgi:hypothetical protein
VTLEEIFKSLKPGPVGFTISHDTWPVQPRSERSISLILWDLHENIIDNPDPTTVNQVCKSLRSLIKDQNIQKLFEEARELHTAEHNSGVKLHTRHDPGFPKVGREQRDLLTAWEVAFREPYKGGALNSFLNALDIQWSKMVEHWDEILGTSQSRCMTIVQSSCAGKSRLVHRFYTPRSFINLY